MIVHVKSKQYSSTQPPERLVSAEEMANKLGTKKCAVLRLHRQGRIPSYSLGHRLVRFDPTAVFSALQQ
jgi:excisionase family DNA binding protein